MNNHHKTERKNTRATASNQVFILLVLSMYLPGKNRTTEQHNNITTKRTYEPHHASVLTHSNSQFKKKYCNNNINNMNQDGAGME